MKREDIIKSVKKLDPNIKEDEEAFKVACILLASAFEGADSIKIGKLLKLPVKDIKKYEANLRKNNVWKENKVYCDWFNNETGSISFWLDVNVALGYVEKSQEP